VAAVHRLHQQIKNKRQSALHASRRTNTCSKVTPEDLEAYFNGDMCLIMPDGWQKEAVEAYAESTAEMEEAMTKPVDSTSSAEASGTTTGLVQIGEKVKTRVVISTLVGAYALFSTVFSLAKTIYALFNPGAQDAKEHQRTKDWVLTVQRHLEAIRDLIKTWEDVVGFKTDEELFKPASSVWTPFESALNRLGAAATRCQDLFNSMAEAKRLSESRTKAEDFWDHPATKIFGGILTLGIAPGVTVAVRNNVDYKYAQGYLCVSDTLQAVDAEMANAERSITAIAIAKISQLALDAKDAKKQ